MPSAIFLPRDFLRAALARARLSVAAKLWEPPAAETGLAVGAKPVPSKEERAREARGVREASAWALRVLRPALVTGAEWEPRRPCVEPSGAEWAPRREVPELSGAECLPGLFAIGFGAQAPASSINAVVRMRNPKIPGKEQLRAAFDKKTGFWKILLCVLCATGYAGPVKKSLIYHKGWIDFNKNGKMDVYEDPSADMEARVEDLLRQMTLEEKTCQLATLYGSGRVLKDAQPTEQWKTKIWKDGIGNIDEELNGLGKFRSEYSFPYKKHVRQNMPCNVGLWKKPV